MDVISLTKDKINKVIISDKEIITKKSSFEEIKNIEKARKIFKNKEILINNSIYTFHLPHIYDYKENKIYMEFMTGYNLELYLRKNEKHKTSAAITNNILQYLYDNKIYWGDFAPRNILIDDTNKRINLCDFERGIKDNVQQKTYLQHLVYEEYAAFLLPQERTFSETMDRIFIVDNIENIQFKDIKSNRVKHIIMYRHLPLNSLTNQTIANINKMIILAETPYLKQNNLVFPIIELEAIKDKSYELFANKVCSFINKGIIDYGNKTRI